MSFLRRLVVIDDRGTRSAAGQMAVDEALLGLTALPVLRFYRWQRASLSFGYFGRYADVSALAESREIVRRWTGGGIVLHGEDFTYSLLIPARDDSYAQPARAVYLAVHSAAQRALAKNGIDARVAETSSPKISETCFANPVRSDLLLGQTKIAGAAQRRTRAGLLQQGSLQATKLSMSFGTDFAGEICSDFHREDLGAEAIRAAEQLAASRYAQEAWLKRR